MSLIKVQSKPGVLIRVKPGGKFIPNEPGTIAVYQTPRILRLLASGQIQKATKPKARKAEDIAKDGPNTGKSD